MLPSYQKPNIQKRTFLFGVRIVIFVNKLPRITSGIAVGNQLIRSGTSIGANIEEAQNAPTKKDFIHGLTISLKEARETEYWLKIIRESKLNVSVEIEELLQEVNEIIKILTPLIKRAKETSYRGVQGKTVDV